MEAIKQNKVYQPLYSTKKRYILVTGGRGSGKSFAVSTAVTCLTYAQDHSVLFTRYTMVAAHKSIIPEFIEKIDLMGVSEHFDITRNEIRNKVTGTNILFSGIKTSSGNQTANLKSLQGISTWVLDEAEELVDERTFDTIDLSIRKMDVNNRVILILNPTTKEHWIFKRWFESNSKIIEVDGQKVMISTHPDVCHIHTTYLDNIENLPESYVNQIMHIKNTNQEKYNHVILGGWLDRAEGAVYTNWETGKFDDSLPYVWGMDFGYSTDPTALVQVAVKDNTVYVKEYLYQTGLSSDQITSILSEYIKGEELIIADCAEPRMIDEIRASEFNIVGCTKGKDSVKKGIANLRTMKIVVDPDSHNLIKELNNYAWHDAKSNTPIDDFNHLLDSLRYAVDELTYQDNFFVV